MENKQTMNITDAVQVARIHASAVMHKAERSDDGELYELGSQLLRGSASKVEKACRHLAEKYGDSSAQKILLGFEI